MTIGARIEIDATDLAPIIAGDPTDLAAWPVAITRVCTARADVEVIIHGTADAFERLADTFAEIADTIRSRTRHGNTPR